MAKGRKTGGGSRKGRPNKISASIREAVASVFANLGDIDGMTEWARANQTEFYKIAARLIPTEQQITGAGGAALAIRVAFVTAAPVPADGHE